MQGKVHAVFSTGIGLGHAYPARGPAVIVAAQVKGQDYLVAAHFIELGIFSVAGGVHHGVHGPLDFRLLGRTLGPELYSCRDCHEAVGVGAGLFLFREFFSETGQERGSLHPLVLYVEDQVFPVEALPVVVSQFKQVAGTQVCGSALAVEHIRPAGDLLGPDLCQSTSLLRLLEVLAVEVYIPAALRVHLGLGLELEGRLAVVVVL